MSLRKIKSFDIIDFNDFKCDIFPFHLTNVNSSFVFNAGGVVVGVATPKGYMRYNSGGYTCRAYWISSFFRIWGDHHSTLTLRCGL